MRIRYAERTPLPIVLVILLVALAIVSCNSVPQVRVGSSSAVPHDGVTVNSSQRAPAEVELVFVAIDVSESSKDYREKFFEAAAHVISESQSRELGVIAFGLKPYELYYGPMLTRRDFIKKAREWAKSESADTRGTDLSAPFVRIYGLMATRGTGSIAVYLYTDAGTELMTKDCQERFVRLLEKLNEQHGLTEVTVSGVRSSVNDNYRQQIRDLFDKTPVRVTIL